MSYDLKLYRKDNSKKPFKEEELKDKLGDSFGFTATHTKNGLAVGFDVGYESERDSIEFHHQEEGYYWTYCSYGVGEKDFIDFKKLVKDVAIKLNMHIQDPQVGENLIEPEDFIPDDTESCNRFGFVKKATQKVVEQLPWILPTKSKHFILYFIMSEDPVTHRNMLLTLGGDKLHASKVEPEESIDQVVKREIPELTGATEYKILQVRNYDTARDSYGNELPRYSVDIEVPYFDPAKKNLKQRVEWRSP